MQVLIKDKKLKVIPNQDMSQIDKGTYFITYMSSELGKKYENEGKLVKKGAVFGVYQIEKNKYCVNKQYAIKSHMKKNLFWKKPQKSMTVRKRVKY